MTTGPDVLKALGVDPPDMINHPPHYTQGDIECISAIAAALGPEGFQAYCRGTIIKYSWRVEHKGAGSQDLGKIGWYADRAIAARKTMAPKVPEPSQPQAPLGGMTGSEFEDVLKNIEVLRRAAKLGPNVSNSGVLLRAANILGMKAMGEALTEAGFVVAPPAPATEESFTRRLIAASREMSALVLAAKGQRFRAGCIEGLSIMTMQDDISAMVMQVRP